MRKAWILVMLIVGGCVFTPPMIPPRYQIGVPSANAATPGTVYLQGVYSSYTISVCAMTNNTHLDPSSPYYADIATNRWPSKRFHIDLSLDGGSNWTRRIGYGVQFDAAQVNCDFIWSPPIDYTMLTTNAVIRATNLDGGPWPARTPARPYDLPEGKYPMTYPFPIVGAVIDSPAADSIQFRGEGTTINWRQVGGGTVYDLYWLTPDSAGADFSHWITTISNVVHGANTKIVSLNTIAAPAVRLAIISQSDPNVIGYSGIFTVDP